MSPETSPGNVEPPTGRLERALLVTGGFVVVLYVVGFLVLPQPVPVGPVTLPSALDIAGLLTALLAVAITLLWIGDRI